MVVQGKAARRVAPVEAAVGNLRPPTRIAKCFVSGVSDHVAYPAPVFLAGNATTGLLGE
jgi:hypothetical protein